MNVGGTGKLPMTDLQAMCRDAGFTEVRTYIASGNVVFQSASSAKKVKSELGRRLLSYAGKPVEVAIRTAAEMATAVESNSFPKAAPNHTVAILLDEAPPPDSLAQAVGVRGEKMYLGVREIYVHYGAGMEASKLRIPAAHEGMARNINMITRLAEIAADL
jgi:uncharacterized protein (DUF1697 family)